MGYYAIDIESVLRAESGFLSNKNSAWSAGGAAVGIDDQRKE
jgi:hypothetical protein